MINRTIVVVIDGFGVGELPDAAKYKDVGSNTLLGIYKNDKLNIPNLKKLGLYNIDNIGIPEREEKPICAFGKSIEQSQGKNSPVGHWEMSGYITNPGFKTYPNAFPKEMIDEFIKEAKLDGILCNKVGSGTELLKRYGEEHIKTGYPIIYTSADSVFQIAAHEDVIPVNRLYEICLAAKKVVGQAKYNIGTIIARPFIGDNKDNFQRTYNRKDFEYEGFGKTMLDVIKDSGKEVVAIGKIEDLFSGRGITKAIHTSGNADGIDKTIEYVKKDFEGLIFTNLVDFDMLYGHRNNVPGYARALEYLDSKIPDIINNMKEDDLLIITSDHGNDPSVKSSDHTREYTPVLVYGKHVKENVNLGVRDTFADISATILDFMNLPKLEIGKSFKKEIEK